MRGRYVGAVLVLVAGAGLIALLGPFRNEDDAIVFSLIAVPCVIAGAIVGEWRALFLSLTALVAVVPLALLDPDSELGVWGVIYLTALITVPFCAVAIAAGVGLRLLVGLAAGRRRPDRGAEP